MNDTLKGKVALITGPLAESGGRLPNGSHRDEPPWS